MSASVLPLPLRLWQRFPLGLRYMAGSALFFSLMSLFVKLAALQMPSMQIVLARCVVLLVLSYGMVRRAGVRWQGVDRRTLIARGVAGSLALSLFYYGIARLPLGDVTALYYSSPLFTGLFAGLLLRERLGTSIGVGMVVGFAGLLLVAQPSFLFGEARLAGVPALATVVGAALSGLAYTLTRKLRATDHPDVVIFWFSLVGVVVALPFARAFVWPDATGWGWLLLVGVSTHLAQVCLTRGLHLEPAGRAAAVGYLQIAFAFGWGLLFFGARPSPLALVGCAVIFGSVLLVAQRDALGALRARLRRGGDRG